MKNKNTFLISLILVCVFVCSLFIMCGGIKGESAYELAVKNGFVGTENEWLTSLKGANGKDAEVLDYHAMYNSCISSGDISADTTYLQFIQSLINTGNQDSQLLAIQNSIRSSVGVFNVSTVSGKTSSSAGSGSFFRIDDDGTAYIVTNYHVTYSEDLTTTKYYITLYEDNYILDPLDTHRVNYVVTYGIEATYIGGIKEYDIGVLKVSDSEKLAQYKANGLITAVDIDYDYAIGKTDLVAGMSCYAIGNAMGEGISATQGIISVVRENIEIPDVEDSRNANVQMRAIRTSCQINGGNSGGGLYSNNGKLIGVVNSRREYQSTSNMSEVNGVGYAIPISVAYAIYNKVLTECEPSLGTTIKPAVYLLGVTVKIAESKALYDTHSGTIKVQETLVIDKIESGKYADGKLIAGDTLISYTVDYASEKLKDVSNPVEICHMYNLSDIILSLSKGDKLTLNVSRANAEDNSVSTVPVLIEIL